ncbi:hypothetical protein CQW23_24424 [Capsicum baccatum]|uniref:Ubiquitin-like domain-containing protein n=1 Tax=Capsicum baccatum TaxID=33114 RepID=A0A2G2VUT6_CAPBA|nr:hypothetical protein CQW23_24424 [Capsicum baccatum]
MQNDQISASASSSFNDKSSNWIHLYVRSFSGETLVIPAYPTDTVEVIHDKITFITGISKIYGGKQLQLDQTVSDCGIEEEEGLQLVGRLRSTCHPQAWQLMNELYSLISGFCKRKYYLVPSNSEHIQYMLTKVLSMSPDDFDLASEHREIFISSSVPAALVMLYMSRTLGHKIIGDECIRRFIISLKNRPVKPIYSRYAIIVLEFCKILRETVGIEDDLYIFCRSTLGAIIEPIGITSCKADKKLVSLQDVFLFVGEIVAQLQYDLLSKSTDLSLSFNLVRDFAAFTLPVGNVISLHVPFGFPITFPLLEIDTDEAQYYRECIEWLYYRFYGLLLTMEFSLRLLEGRLGLQEKGEDTQVVQIWWSLCLKILKELNDISKLYTGMENVFWQKMREVKPSLCCLIVKLATESEDYGWLFEHKEVTDFKVRRHLAMLLLPEVGDNEALFYMLSGRSKLLEESFGYIGNASLENLRGSLFVEFKHEEATGSGVLREWF